MYWITYSQSFGIISCESAKPASNPHEVFMWPRMTRVSSVIEGYTAPDPRATQTWGDVRAIRDYLLTESDWTQMADSPLSDEARALWKTYRQRLRDLPEVYLTPQDVIYPTKPEA